jgi:voltage-gated potassium channel
MTITSIRKSIFAIVEPAEKPRSVSKAFDVLILTLIVANTISVILESFDSVYLAWQIFFRRFELVSVIIFTIEYSLRLITAEDKYPGPSKLKSYTTFVFSPQALIDLAAIVPFYLPFLFAFDLRFIRILRLLRLSRMFKLTRYSSSLQLLGRVLARVKERLYITLFVTALLLIVSGALLYYVETDAQPEVFPNMAASFWWAMATLTTVGYGDIYPVTASGKLIASLIAVLAIGLVALPTGIISAGFIVQLEEDSRNRRVKRRRAGNLKRMYHVLAHRKKLHRGRKLTQMES